MFQFLNVFFLVFHSVLLIFNCIGWIWKRTRLLHLVTVALTLFSWLVFGYWHGWGYCLCTDWHWRIRERLGYPYDHSYTHLLFLEMTGMDVSPRLADVLTAGIFALVTLLTVALNARDFRGVKESRTLKESSPSPKTQE